MAKRKKKLPAPKAYAPAANAVNNLTAPNTQRYDDVYYEHHLGKVQSVTKGKESGSFLVSGSDRIWLRLQFTSPEVVRIQYALDELGPDFSYAIDPEFEPTKLSVKKSEDKKAFHLSSKVLKVSIAKKDGQLTIRELAGNKIVHQQAAPFQARTTLLKGLEQVRFQFKALKDEAFYGLGDKSGDTDLRGRQYENWCTDSFGYGNHSDALYRAIPFFYGLRRGMAYGCYLDNSYRTHFDFDSYKDDTVTVWADGGDFNYYFIYGPELDSVAKRYHELTGLPEMPPLWAMGFHQCRWSYYPESRVRELADEFREKQFPCDAIYLDIDYMDGYRCFTWNKEYFPNPKQLVKDLRKSNFHTVVMIDPGIRVDPDYHVYKTGIEKDVFCRRPDGRLMTGPVWPPNCVWPDYTKPEVRDWWGPLYKELYNKQGISGFWNDMNEPAVFKVHQMTFPEDVRHDYEGYGSDHAKAHNIYGMQMSRATYDGLKDLQPKKRPFLLCRASFSGGQRYAALWTGDNVASWEHLRLANSQCLRLSISGYSFVGTDIGGFVDEPTGELMVRWLQLGAFHPVMRVHSMGNNSDGAAEAEAEEVKKAEKLNRQDQEPWVYGEPYTTHAREAINLRYRLLPYLYTAFRQHLNTGRPLLRNLFFLDQQDPNCRKYGDQFMVGDDLLVCPVMKPKTRTMTIYLPKGEWYDYWTNKLHKGGQKVKLRIKPNQIPIFVRAGAVLPQVDSSPQSTAELLKTKALQLDIYAAAKGGSNLYLDAGEGYAYQEDGYQEIQYSFKLDASKGMAIKRKASGSYKTAFKRIQLNIHGFSKTVKSVKAGREKLAFSQKDGTLQCELPFDFRQLQLTFR